MSTNNHQHRRSVSATIKMTPGDMQHLTEAAEMRWPGVTRTTSSMLLDLAKLGADCIKHGTIPSYRTLTHTLQPPEEGRKPKR